MSIAHLTDATLEVGHRSLVLADREHDEDVPDRMRIAADAVEHVRVRPARGEVALGEVRRVEDEPGDVREERGHNGAHEREHRGRGVHVGERGERRDAREGEREEEGDAVVLWGGGEAPPLGLGGKGKGERPGTYPVLILVEPVHEWQDAP